MSAGFLDTILKKLGLRDEDPPPPAVIAEASRVPIQAGMAEASRTPPPSVAISRDDVVAKLDAMAAANSETLDWKLSIVDLLKVLGIDSSKEARIELATELGCPDALMKDSAKRNTWLHKTVLQKLADNGGNIPKELL